MDIENFTDDELKDELLKVVDEMFNRGIKKQWIFNFIENGKRLI